MSDETVIFEYPLHQAIDDGVLVEIFKPQWPTLTNGKPLVATAHITSEISPAGLIEIWNAYVEWRQHVMPTLPEEERLFSTNMNGRKVWVLEDGQAFTILYPEDYQVLCRLFLRFARGSRSRGATPGKEVIPS